MAKTTKLPDSAQSGDELIVDWTWTLNIQTGQDYLARLVWDCDDGTRVSSAQVPLVTGYSVDRWQPADTWRGVQRLYVPGQLQTGSCQISVRVQDPQQKELLTSDIGRMRVQAPDRSYELPATDHRPGIVWQNGLSLPGYDWQGHNLRLFWTSAEPLVQSLRLFVQALDAEGQLLWQVDEVPVQWSRPTTSWDVQEIITTNFTLPPDLPQDFSLIVGWYDPITGQRVQLRDSTQDYAPIRSSSP